MRLTHILAPAPFGGLEQVVFALVKGQRDRGHDVEVMLLEESGRAESSIGAQLQDAGVKVARVVLPHRAYLSQFRVLRDRLRDRKPEVVHTHGYLPDVMSRVLMHSDAARRVSTVHGFVSGSRRTRLYEWMQCRVYRRIDAVAVSNKLAKELVNRGVPASRVHVIQNVRAPGEQTLSRAAAAELLGLSGRTFNVGWVGRVAYEKGLDVLVKAVEELRDLPIRLTVIGDGPERNRIEHMTAANGMSSMVHWAGVLPEASRVISAFDVIALSSRTEGMPLVLLEAMGASVPIVATAVGGIPEAITSEHGVLVPQENPTELAGGIRAVFMDRVGASRRADAARARLASDFSVESWLDKYDEVYAGLTRTA